MAVAGERAPAHRVRALGSARDRRMAAVSGLARRAGDGGHRRRRRGPRSADVTLWSKVSPTRVGDVRRAARDAGRVSPASRGPRPRPARRARAARRRRASRLTGAAPRRAARGGRRSAPRRGRSRAGPRDDDEVSAKPGAADARPRPERHSRAGRARRRAASSRAGGAGTRRARRASRSARGRGAPGRETASASGSAAASAACAASRAARPSSAAPASIIVWAHAPWATMWIVEFVKKTITGHISTPRPKSKPGPEVGAPARGGARPPSPTIASASRQQRRATGSRSRTASGRARGRLHRVRASRSSISAGRDQQREHDPDPRRRAAAARRAATRSPAPCGCSSVSRYGCRNAQTTPPSTQRAERGDEPGAGRPAERVARAR